MANDPYEHGIDRLIRAARTITPESERAADEVFTHAKAVNARHPIPTGYIVKADIRCNQLDSFRLVACDWQRHLEARRERIQTLARGQLRTHLVHAHPYLAAEQVRQLLAAIQFNFRDFGR
jgi:hypothetical protein